MKEITDQYIHTTHVLKLMLFYTACRMGVNYSRPPSIINKNNRQNTELNLLNYRNVSNSSPITELLKSCSIILLNLIIGVE